MRYICKRCAYGTNIKCNLINHLTRKKPCIATHLDIPTKTLIDELVDKNYELNNTLIIVLNITRKNNKYIFRSKNIVETGIRKVKKISKKSMYFFVFEIKKKFQIFPARKSRNS